MAKDMVVCDGVRHLGLAVGCDGSISYMGSGLQRWIVRWGSVVCRDGLCDGLISDGVVFDFRWGVFEREWGF
ncbi:unnamed protein product [Prunus armeniaca]